jgi:hypothetical protein
MDLKVAALIPPLRVTRALEIVEILKIAHEKEECPGSSGSSLFDLRKK